MKIHRIDHVSINVNDLPAAKAFFLDLGLEVQGEGESEGQWLDQIVRLKDVKTAFVFLAMPNGQASLELVKYYRPSDEKRFSRLWQIPWGSGILPLSLTISKRLLRN